MGLRSSECGTERRTAFRIILCVAHAGTIGTSLRDSGCCDATAFKRGRNRGQYYLQPRRQYLPPREIDKGATGFFVPISPRTSREDQDGWLTGNLVVYPSDGPMVFHGPMGARWAKWPGGQ